jgi:hypothetical protein
LGCLVHEVSIAVPFCIRKTRPRTAASSLIDEIDPLPDGDRVVTPAERTNHETVYTFMENIEKFVGCGAVWRIPPSELEQNIS